MSAAKATRSERLAVPALLALPALAMCIWLVKTQHVPLLAFDSSSYIGWGRMRSVGYPLFLWVVSGVDRTLEIVPYVQLALFAGSAVFLGAMAHRVFARVTVGVAVAGLILAIVPLGRMCLSILSESVFASALMVHLGVVLLLLERRSPARWTLVGLTAFAAILVRPAGMSLVVALPLLMWLPSRDLAGFAKHLVLPLALAWAAFAGANAVWRGSFGLQEIGGMSAVGHAALLLDEDVPSSLPRLNKAIAEALRPHREAAEERHSIEERFLFTLTEYNTMLGIVIEQIRRYIAEGGPLPPELNSPSPEAVLNRISGRLTQEAVRHHRRRYLAHVASHLYGFWRIPNAKSRDDVERLQREYVQRYPKAAQLPGHRDRFFAVVTARSNAIVLLKDLALGAVLVASIAALLLLLAPHRRDRCGVAMAYASLNLHAALLLVAMVQAALWRYSVVWAPYGVLMAVLLVGRPFLRCDGSGSGPAAGR